MLVKCIFKPDFLFLILFSFFLSSLSSVVLIKYLSLPFNVGELLIMPFLFYYRKRIYFPPLVVSQFLLIGLLLYGLGIFWHDSELIGMLSSLRYYFFFVLGFMLFRYNNLLSIRNIVFCAAFSTIFDLLAGFILIQQIQFQNLINEDMELVNNVNFMLIAIFIAYSFTIKSKIIAFVILLISFTSSILSMTRGILLFSVVASIFSLLLTSISSKSQMKVVIVFFFLIIVGFWVYNNTEEEILQLSPSMHHRLYTKMNDGSAGDDTRIYHLTYMLENIGECLIPHGFPVWNNLERFKQTDWVQSSIRDSSLAAFVYTFGVFTFVLFYKYISLFINYWRLFLKNRRADLSILLVVFILFPLYWLFGYGMIDDISKIFSFGMILGVVNRLLFYKEAK